MTDPRWKQLQAYLRKERKEYRVLVAQSREVATRQGMEQALYVLDNISRRMRWISQEARRHD